MKFFKKLFPVLILCAIGFLNSRVTQRSRDLKQRPSSLTQIPQPSQTAQQQPSQAPRSYAQALASIKTWPSNRILMNNTFTTEFINFVRSLNLSPIETEALLQAGAHLHITFTNDQEMNRNMLTSLNNTIGSIIQSVPAPIAPPIAQPRPAMQPQPVTPPSPAMQPQPIAPQRQAMQPRQVTPPTAQPRPASPPRRVAQPQKPAQPVRPVIQQPVSPIASIEAPKDHMITNNLILMLDPNKDESIERNHLALTNQTILALFEKASPIITTSNILENILKIRQMIGEQNLQKLRSIPIERVVEQAQIMAQSSNQSIIRATTLIFLSQIDFNTINFYFHKSAQLVLMIPKQYIQTNLPKAIAFNNNDQAAVCGFNTNALNAITDTNANNLMQQLQKQQSIPLDPQKFIPNLTAMFIPQKKGNELISPEQDAQWLIYLIGHGGHAFLSIGFVREQLSVNQKNLQQLRQYGSRDTRIQQQMALAESNVKKYTKMAEGKGKTAQEVSAWPDSQIVPESASIAGISPDQFAQLMKFFDTTINTAYVHYTTCFSGGVNRTFVNETLSALDVNYIVSTEGMQEAYTASSTGGITTIIKNRRYELQLTHISFAEFFRLLRLFFTDPERYVKIKGKQADPIIKIIQTISTESKTQKPFVRFPGAGAFTATPTTKETQVITKTKVRAHEIENKPFVINPRVDTIIINSPRINVPINLGQKRARGYLGLVLPSPKENIAGYEGINVFKEINYQDNIQSLIFNFVHLNARLYTQTIITKSLKGIIYPQSGLPNTPANITNFIIQMKGVSVAPTGGPSIQSLPIVGEKLRSGQVGLNIQVAFELDNTIYQTSFSIRNIENTDDIYRNLQQLRFTATPKQSINMNTFAAIFLTSQEIAEIPKPITMNSIVEFFDTKIDKQDPSMALPNDDEALRQFVQQRVKK